MEWIVIMEFNFEATGINISTTIYISAELYNATLDYLETNDGNSFSELVGLVLATFLHFKGISKYGFHYKGCRKRDKNIGRNVSKPVKFSKEFFEYIKKYISYTEFTSFSEISCQVLGNFLKFKGPVQYSYGKSVLVVG